MVCQENFGREREGRGAEQVLQVDVRTLRQGRCRGGPSRQAGQSGNRGVYQRRRAGREGARRLGWKPEVAENLAHDVSGLDRSDHGHATAAAGTGEHVEVKDATHQIRPGPVAGLLGGARPALLGRGHGARFRSAVEGARARLFPSARTLLDR